MRRKVERGGDKPFHTVINGENFHVLKALLYTHRGRVDAIYIDPPYNTGNDFAYHDNFQGDRGAGRAGRHTAWLDFMRPRLLAGHRVLAETGAIFISIDDHEVAHLRLLLDEVYGEANFLAQIVVNLNPKGRQLGRGFATSHEYVLAYARHLPSCAVDGSTTGYIAPKIHASDAARATPSQMNPHPSREALSANHDAAAAATAAMRTRPVQTVPSAT